eukprot:TRINITY_DN974_c0_g1_i1.p1 TRINITY_DN974_c0_g1~~TRINITY_DN974_c0_g1_i1.p1  ORF type:complete len:357 (+),score=113.91 TRINITY_DN974_c0_g1_i1:52-1122(+)
MDAPSPTTTKKVICITKHGGYEVLQVQTVPDRKCNAGEVKIKVKAAGLNFAEVSARMGLYPDAPPPPCVVGYEAAGEIVEVGEGVPADLTIGLRVMAAVRFGAHSSSLIIPAKQLIVIPPNMSYEEAAALLVNYLTAYHILFRVACIQPGDSVLIHSAAGGVGIAAIQLCKTVPNVTIFGTASQGKHDVIKGYGCDHCIDYRTQDYTTEVRRLTNGKGVDVIMDALGDFQKNYDLLRQTGKLIAFGAANFVSGETRNLFTIVSSWMKLASFKTMQLMSDNKLVAGVNMGHLFNEDGIEMMKNQALILVQLFVDGKIKPRVDKVFTFEEAGAAHKYMQERRNIGKVVLVPEKLNDSE